MLRTTARERRRARTVIGVYRLWRDLCYALGSLLAGLVPDAGLATAIWLVAGITFASGVVVAVRMRETHARPKGDSP